MKVNNKYFFAGLWFVLTTIDFTITQFALRTGKFREENLIAAWFFNRGLANVYFLITILIICFITFCLNLLFKIKGKDFNNWAWGLITGICLSVYAFVLYNNFSLYFGGFGLC